MQRSLKTLENTLMEERRRARVASPGAGLSFRARFRCVFSTCSK